MISKTRSKRSWYFRHRLLQQLLYKRWSAALKLRRIAAKIKSILPKKNISQERVFFSFSLFGSNKKYTEGMVANAQQISARFPTAITQIYIADDVPTDIVARLELFPNVRLVHVKRVNNLQNTFNRFLSIDDPDCDIMFSRDADSRIHDRDAACIEDFIASDKVLHIIRDHHNHDSRIMGGMWGIRKKALLQSMQSHIQQWMSHANTDTGYSCDQRFLQHVIYPAFIGNAMIHDRYRFFNEPVYQPFRVPIIDRLFVGQVHLFNEAGKEYTEFDA
jgi:hypothetical protein